MMTLTERAMQVRRYFERPKPLRGLLIFFWLIVPLLIAFGRLVMNAFMRSKLNDQDVDQLVAAALVKGREMAERQLFGVTANRADLASVVEFYVPYVRPGAPTPAVPREDMLARRGKDDRLRFSSYQFVYMYPTLNYLSLFTTQYNLITDTFDERGQEREYPYRHIVSVESGPRFEEFREQRARKNRSLVVGYWFSLVNSGGERFEAGISYEGLDVALPGERINKVVAKGQLVAGFEDIESSLTDAVKRIRDILRQKEQTSQSGSQGPAQWGPPAGGSIPEPN